MSQLFANATATAAAASSDVRLIDCLSISLVDRQQQPSPSRCVQSFLRSSFLLGPGFRSACSGVRPVEREGGRGRLGAPPALKNTEKGVPDIVFLTSNMRKINFRPELRPGPHWGSLRCSLRPYSRMVRGHPSPSRCGSRRA